MPEAENSDQKLRRVFEEIKSREPIFHHPEFGTSRLDFERMIVEDFWEVGASGSRYDRQFVLDNLEERHSVPVEEDYRVEDCECRPLSETVYLFTYVLWQEERRTRRATVWMQNGANWKIVYHQGTLTQTENYDPSK